MTHEQYQQKRDEILVRLLDPTDPFSVSSASQAIDDLILEVIGKPNKQSRKLSVIVKNRVQRELRQVVTGAEQRAIVKGEK